MYEFLQRTEPDTKKNQHNLRRKDKIIQMLYMNLASEGEITQEEAYKKIIEEGDDCLDVFLYATIDYCSKKKFDEAMDMADRAARCGPNNVIALFNKAFTLFCIKEVNKAMRLINRAIDCNTYNYSVYLLKALIFALYGEYDQSMKTLDDLKEKMMNRA